MSHVSYKTAKLAKEKGFDRSCNATYTKDGGQNSFKALGGLQRKNSTYPDIIAAPTCQELNDWLREELKLYVEITWDPAYEWEPGKWADSIWEITIVDLTDPNKSFSPSWQRHSGEQLEYYPAFEKGLSEALKLIL